MGEHERAVGCCRCSFMRTPGRLLRSRILQQPDAYLSGCVERGRSCTIAVPTGSLPTGRPTRCENKAQGGLFNRVVPKHSGLDPDDHSN